MYLSLSNRSAMNVLLLALIVLSSSAYADNFIKLTSAVEQEVVVKDKRGKKTVKRVPAEKVVPGDEVIYTTVFTNVGDEPADNIVIKNPIPEHTFYKDGSAAGGNTVVTYSVDGGRTFDKPQNLFVKEKGGSKRLAKASEYTDIRWEYKPKLHPGKKSSVQFRAVLE